MPLPERAPIYRLQPEAAAPLLGMSVEELRSLPASIPLVTAGRAFGLGRRKSYEMARAGTFPIGVLKLGDRYRCVTAELLRALGVES